MKWYYVAGKDRLGPFDENEFSELVANGTISDRTLVWNQSMENWQPFESVADQFEPPPETDLPPEIAPDMVSDSGPSVASQARCSECGRTFPEDELIRYEGSSVCSECKPAFVQKIREGVSVGSLVYAGFWIRFAAKFIDGLILGALNFVIGLVVGMMTHQGGDPSAAMATNLALSGFQMCIAAAYSCWFLGKFAATPGKMACGLTVITGSHGKVSYIQGFGRYFGELLSSIILCIGYLMVAFDSEKRGLHDRICNTRVVYAKSLE